MILLRMVAFNRGIAELYSYLRAFHRVFKACFDRLMKKRRVYCLRGGVAVLSKALSHASVKLVQVITRK